MKETRATAKNYSGANTSLHSSICYSGDDQLYKGTPPVKLWSVTRRKKRFSEGGNMAANMFFGNMAEGTVYFLLGKMAKVLETEVSLLSSVCREIEDVKHELESMRSFLKDANERRDVNEGVRTWTSQVRDVAYEVEDIIDEFLYLVNRPRTGRGAMGCFRGAIHLPGRLLARHQVGSQLQGIKEKVRAISERRSRYHLDGEDEGSSLHSADEEWHERQGNSYFLEDDVVGIEENRDLLIGWLTQEEEQRTVLSVVGMGGLGKTTLVKKAYNNQIVKGHFDCCAWISVSQTYRIEELLKDMATELFKAEDQVLCDISSIKYAELEEMLIRHMQPKRYIVILDDVWSVGVWNDIAVALPNNRCGSRIVITTRKVDVASSLGDGSHVFYLEPLSQDDSWTLFCKKAFWSDPDKRCPQELQPLAGMVVERCEGLPLAIVAIGGLMSTKERTVLEWRKVYSSLTWELSYNPILDKVKSILLLSFNDLPHYLKPCFLYCTVFPEDYVIKRKRLIRLWIAEGFVEERRGMTMEDVADTYLKELVCRNMLQVAKVNYFGRVKACRVHDLIRDLALSICENENFCTVSDGKEAREERSPRRLSIQHSDRTSQFARSKLLSRLRSFLAFIPDAFSAASLKATLSGFRLLKVLDLQGVSIDRVPNELVALFNLRYLSLKGTKVKSIPESLSSLQNLQTLDIRDTLVEKLPRGINKLLKLRHLLVFRYLPREVCLPFRFSYISGLSAPRGLGNLSNLQTLTCVRASEDVIQEVGNLSGLQRFSIIDVKAQNGRNLSASIRKMKQLLYLIILASEEEEPLHLETLASPPPLLQKLILGGSLEKLPHWFASLSNLSFLSLHCSQLKEDALPLLGTLPNLIRLLLQKAYVGEYMVFRAGWFPKLKTLSLWEITVNILEVEKGSLSSIQQLWMGFCEGIKTLPRGIEYLTTLKQLYLEQMPEELVQSLIEEKSKAHNKIQIPNIKYTTIPSIKYTEKEKVNFESLSY